MYEALLLIDPDTPVTIKSLQVELEKFYKTDLKRPDSIRLMDCEIQLVWPDFTLTINYSEAPYVIELSREVAGQFAKMPEISEQVRQCRACFEITGDDDPDMDHFNDYVFVIQAAEHLGTIYAFDPVAGELI
jgi:hypothetical protein